MHVIVQFMLSRDIPVHNANAEPRHILNTTVEHFCCKADIWLVFPWTQGDDFCHLFELQTVVVVVVQSAM